jgi:hypothetical protein
MPTVGQSDDPDVVRRTGDSLFRPAGSRLMRDDCALVVSRV